MFSLYKKIKQLSLAILVVFMVHGCGSGSSSDTNNDNETTTDIITEESTNTETEQEDEPAEPEDEPIIPADESADTTPTVPTYYIVDTAQIKCYDSNNGSEENCTNTGYDANYNGNQPNYSISTSGNIITDNVTSLMWTQSSDIDNDGQTTDVDDKLNYDDSIAYCSNLTLDEYDDWRLPDIKTLYSLILFSGEDPSSYQGDDTSELVTFLDGSFTRAFGDTSANERIIDGQYATTTKYVSTTMNGDETMFGVNFVDGRIKGYPLTMQDQDKLYYVLCVRGEEEYGKNNFINNENNTITDNATALMWEQDDSQSSNFEDAITICENSITADFTDWRLPNVKELQSIVDYTKSPDTTSSAAIDSIFNSTSFTNEGGETDWGYYWSSTTHASYGGNGSSGSYISFGRALGYMGNTILDVHGAGAQRSNEKMNENGLGSSSAIEDDGSTFYYKGPQGDILRIDNMVRCVRDTSIVQDTPDTTDESSDATNEVSSGYILFSTMGSNDTRLIDTNGSSVKTWNSSYSASGASYLTSTNTLLRSGVTTNARGGTFATGGAIGGIIEEIDTSGDVIWSYILDNDNYTFHHDFKQLDNNTIIALTWELKSYNNKNYWNEKIIKIDKLTSSIVWEWSAMDDGNLLPTTNSEDFLHFNSIDYKNGKILISSKTQNKLYLIDENDKTITETYTVNGTLNGQHDATFLDNGNILVFNNNSTATQSKIIELDINDNIVWEYSDDFFSDHISGVQRLANGNTLICSGTEGRFIEVSQDKEELWEYTNNYTTTTPNGEMNSVFKIRKYESYN